MENAPEPPPTVGPELLGTRLRRLLDELESGVAAAYRELGLDGFRHRYTPVLRVLGRSGPLAIRELAGAVGVTHSAASQTVALLAKEGLAVTSPGQDARRRVVSLTSAGQALLPVLDVEWAATAAAAEELEAELSHSLSGLVEETLAALRRRPMQQRIAEAAAQNRCPAPPD